MRFDFPGHFGPDREFSDMTLSNHAHQQIRVLTSDGTTYYIKPSQFFRHESVMRQDVLPGVPFVLRKGTSFVDVGLATHVALTINPRRWPALPVNLWPNEPSWTLVVNQIQVGGRLSFGTWEDDFLQSSVIKAISIPFSDI